jgi:hypothetical protein
MAKVSRPKRYHFLNRQVPRRKIATRNPKPPYVLQKLRFTQTLRRAQVGNPDRAWKRRTDWQVSIVDINSSLSHLLHHCKLHINVCPQWSYLHTPVIHLSCHCCLPDAGGSKKIHMISHKQGTQDVLQNIRWLVKQSGDGTCQQRTLCTRRQVRIACTRLTETQ